MLYFWGVQVLTIRSCARHGFRDFYMQYKSVICSLQELSESSKTQLINSNIAIEEIDHPMFDSFLQVAKKVDSQNVGVVYVGVLSASACFLIQIDDLYDKIIRAYGEYEYINYLRVGKLYSEKAKSKLPVFTKLFCEKTQVGKPYTMVDKDGYFIALQLYAKDLDYEMGKKFYSAINYMFNLATFVVNEAKDAKLDDKLFMRDITKSLRILLHLTGL